jgi:hypothetical protein
VALVLVLGFGLVAGWQLLLTPQQRGQTRFVSQPKKPPSKSTAPLPGLNFSEGFTAGRGLTCSGTAGIRDGRLQLTSGGCSEAGSAFANQRLRISRFSSEFTFQLLNAQADGFTFTIQGVSPCALGASGGGLGYGPDPGDTSQSARIARSVAVKFDLYNNSGEGGNSTGLFTNGAAPGVPATDLTSAGIDLHSGHIFHVTLSYDGGVLKVTITDRTTKVSAMQVYLVDIPALVGGSTGFVGFTGGTGGLSATQQILTWQFSPLP